MSENIKGKTILITGGTGSFGNTVVATLLKAQPARIIIFSRDEKKQFDMRNAYRDRLLKFVIGDVRDPEAVDLVMKGVDFVFHAAALKQVPTCDFFPVEAVKTNILGAYHVLRAAIERQVKRVVILSTDKAVYPINAMGMTKGLMEKVMVAFSRELQGKANRITTVCGVRYGNVLYSRGSVIPYFVDLIKQHKVLTVTNKQMTRFLLPLREAVDLVLHVLTQGENGHLYVRKSSACTLETLVEAIIQLFHYSRGWKEVGVRAGEKLHETLVTREELARATDQGLYFDIPPESQGLDYDQYFSHADVKDSLPSQPYTSENTHRLGVRETIKLLQTLPEIQAELRQIKKGK